MRTWWRRRRTPQLRGSWELRHEVVYDSVYGIGFREVRIWHPPKPHPLYRAQP